MQPQTKLQNLGNGSSSEEESLLNAQRSSPRQASNSKNNNPKITKNNSNLGNARLSPHGLSNNNDTVVEEVGGGRLDPEAYQQHVCELFEQFTNSNVIHKLDLLDMLEDLGYPMTMDQLSEAVTTELGLGVEASKKDKEKIKSSSISSPPNKTGDRMPSNFDLDDTLLICTHFYNKDDDVRRGAVENTVHVEVVDIQLQVYLKLLFTCGRNPRLQYRIVKPQFLDFKVTPKKMLIGGAGGVMLIMCILVLLTLSVLWIQNVKSNEKESAQRYSGTFSSFMDQFEYQNGKPLIEVFENVEYLGGLQTACFKSQLAEEEANLDRGARTLAGSSSHTYRPDLQDARRVLTVVEAALLATHALLLTSSLLSPAAFQSILEPLLSPVANIRPKVGSTTSFRNWDYVVTNMSTGSAAVSSPQIISAPSMLCAGCNFAYDECATRITSDDEDSIANAASGSTSALAALLLTTSTSSGIVSHINASGLLPNGVPVVSVSAYYATLGITICFYRPQDNFVEQVNSQVAEYFTSTFSGAFKEMTFSTLHNLVKYNPVTGAMAHVVPLEVSGTVKANCADGNGCENGAIRDAVAAASTNCTVRGDCELTSTTSSGVDNSSAVVVCSARSFGFPVVTDYTVILCRPWTALQAVATNIFVLSANNANLYHALTTQNLSPIKAGSTEFAEEENNDFEIVAASRNSTTGIVTAQLTNNTKSLQCAGPCFRSSPASAAAQRSFTAGLAEVAAANSVAGASKSRKVVAIETPVGRITTIAPDYRHQVPTFQGYAYLPMLGMVVGQERDVASARREGAIAMLSLISELNAKMENMAIVPVTRHVTFEPTRHFNSKDPCPTGTVCIDRSAYGYGIVYRSDCPDCSAQGEYGLIHSLISLPFCDDSENANTCRTTIGSMEIYNHPFSFQQGGAGDVDTADSYAGLASVYAPVYVKNISLGIVLHYYTTERLDSAYQKIYAAIGICCAFIVIGLGAFLVASRDNLNKVELEWYQFKKSIHTQKTDFSRVVGDVVPAVYAPLLFLPSSCIAERLSITTIFINFVGFQRHIVDQDADFLHDYISYTFFAINAITRYYKMFKVKTFGDNFMIVAGVNKQMASRSAAIKNKMKDEGSVIASTLTADDRNVDDNEDMSIARCVEAAAVIMQLFSYMFIHNPQHIGFLRKRIKAKQIQDMAMVRIGIATGPTNLIMTRHDGFPFFLALSEYAAVAYKLQQAAKSNSINISSDVKKALIRVGKDNSYEFGKDRTLLHKKIVVTSTLIQKANVPIPPAILNNLRVGRSPYRLFFAEDGALKAAMQGVTNAGGGSTLQMANSEKASVHSGSNSAHPNAAGALARLRGSTTK